MAQVSKITPTGTLYTAGALDEVTYNPNSGVKKNLLNYSQNFTTAYWSVLSQYASYVTNATLAPDGTNTATKLVESNQNNYHVFYTGSGIQAVAGQYYCNSIYVKAAERYMFAMYAGGSSNWTSPPSAVFNLQTGTVVSGSTNLPAFIKDVGNGWYRCSTQGIYANYTLGVSFNFGPCLPGATSTNNVVYQGDGTSGIYVWGAQQEFTTLGAGPTIYEPTGTNAVPAPTFAARTDSAGNNYIANIYDEVTYNPASGVQKNLFVSSNNFSYGGYSRTITANATLAPDSTQTASLMIESSDSVLSFHGASNQFVTVTTGTFVAGTTYTISLYIKNYSGDRKIIFGLGTPWFRNAGYSYGIFDPTTGVAGIFLSTGATPTVSMQDVGNGWYRCRVTTTPTITWPINSPSYGLDIQLTNLSNSNNYIGNGTSGMYLWGGQAEQETTATMYVPTVNSLPTPRFAQSTEFTGNVYVSGNYDEVSQPLNPVTDSSLIMHLDPAMTNSYPGTGTTWYDLSGYGNHATFLTGAIPTGIQKAPGYSTDYGGIIVLNGGQQSVANMPGDNVWANTAIKTSTFTPQMDRTFSIWVRFHNTTNSLAWMNPVSYGITGTTSSYTYGTGSAPTPPIVGNPLIASNPSGYTRTYGAQGILLGCNYYGDYGLSWNSLIYNAQNNFQIESENRINSPSYVEYSPYYSYISNPPAVNPFYGTWHNIVGTYSYSTNYQAIYVDGVAMNTSTTSAFAGLTYPMTFPSLMIGYAGEAGGNSTYAYLDGDVGQCLVYKRALSAAEVLQNFTTYRARYGV